jgi:hypothetical protein
MNSLQYLLHNGKNSKIKYYTVSYFRLFTPKFLFRCRLQNELKRGEQRDDKAYIFDRVNYYNKREEQCVLPSHAERIGDLRKNGKASAYFFDIFEYLRWFPTFYRWCYKPGDINYTLPDYSITKSRPISEDNQNSVIINLDKNRHFTFVHDRVPFEKKKDRVIFRGKVQNKKSRRLFIEKFIDNPRFNVGDVTRHSSYPLKWQAHKMTIFEHLEYRYIMSLEGNDVASNLKWIMSSNSIAVTPKLTCETWFMEGKLIPNYHYIEVKPDFSDLEDKLDYYSSHLEEAHEIIRHAHEYVQQFQDKRRERLISLLVLDKYFKLTGQRK